MFFRVDETCVGRHFYERRPWARNGESLENLDQQLVEQQAESTDPVSEGYNASMEDLEITEKEAEDFSTLDDDAKTYNILLQTYNEIEALENDADELQKYIDKFNVIISKNKVFLIFFNSIFKKNSVAKDLHIINRSITNITI